MVKQPNLAHVKFVRAKGKLYAYFNTGKKVNGKLVFTRLPEFGTAGFYETYSAMLGHRTRRGEVVLTVADLIDRYERSPEWEKLSKGSKHTYRMYLNRIRDELGKFQIEKVQRAHVREILDNRMTGNGARNLFLAVVGILFKWARDHDLAPEHKNPTSGIKSYDMGERDPWPEELIEAALVAEHDRVRLAVHLLYYTGQRIGDVMKMRWSDIRNGVIVLTPQKTKRHKKTLHIPLHSALEAELARTPKTGFTIITNWKGAQMRQDVVRKELKAFGEDLGFDIVPHGLRKNAVNSLLEAGCTIAETASITGQSFKVVEHYARKVDQQRLGEAAIIKLERKRPVQTRGKLLSKAAENGGIG